jgi:hypothetical protein
VVVCGVGLVWSAGAPVIVAVERRCSWWDLGDDHRAALPGRPSLARLLPAPLPTRRLRP